MTSLPSNFPRRVRIRGGEFGASARAMHRKAALENVSKATIERKTMSTKTTLKRIALVAVAAVGFGMLAVAPSSAAQTVAQTYLYCSLADGGAISNTSTTGATCNGVAGIANTVTLAVVSSAKDILIVTSSGVLASKVAGSPASVVASGGGSATVGATNGTATFTLTTPVAGTQTVSVYTATAGTGIYSATAAETVVITVSGSAQSGGIDVANSKSYLVAGESTTAITDVVSAADATVVASATYSTTASATIKLKIVDLLGAALNDSLTATITSGPGSVMNVNGTPTASQSATSAAGDTGGLHKFYVYASGASGVTTITIKDGSTVVSTETVTFSGVAATYSVKVVKAYNKIGANADAVEVTAKDSAGNLVSPLTIYAFDGTAATGTILSQATTASGIATFSYTGIAVGASVITFGNASSVATSTVTGTATLNVSKSTAKTVTLSLDKDTYAAGDVMTLTVKALDANGAPVADGALPALFTTGISSSQALSGGDAALLSTLTTPATVSGVKTYTLYAPLGGGVLTLTTTEGGGTDNVIAGGTAATISITATITNPSADAAVDAANAATDAANYAADAADAATTAAQEATAAAQAAQDSADAATAAVVALGLRVDTLMASVRAQLTSLSNLLVRIIKKTKA